jgi:hypothetical protein
MGGKVAFTHPCMVHQGVSIQNKQGGMKMTLTPAAGPALVEDGGRGGLEVRVGEVQLPPAMRPAEFSGPLSRGKDCRIPYTSKLSND